MLKRFAYYKNKESYVIEIECEHGLSVEYLKNPLGTQNHAVIEIVTFCFNHSRVYSCNCSRTVEAFHCSQQYQANIFEIDYLRRS